ASIDLPLAATGGYIFEIVGAPGISTAYDLYLSCDSQTNNQPVMQVLYNGTNVVNGGTVIFPSTLQGSPINVTLVLTNAGTGPFSIYGYGTNGGFVLTNNVWGGVLTLNGGQSTNFGIVFGAATNGINQGALAMATN